MVADGPGRDDAGRPADTGDQGTRERDPARPAGGGGLYIGVAATSEPDARVARLAHELGRRLAEGGATIVCGGGQGAMAAVCAGAREAGGVTIGLLPGSDRAEGNDDLSVALPTGLGQGRNLLLVRASDALVAIGGGFGTLSEIAHALRTDVPVIGMATWSLALAGRPVTAFPTFDDPAEAAHAALTAAAARREARHRSI
jgi:uncharacterized protein (TIGR00725 family)